MEEEKWQRRGEGRKGPGTVLINTAMGLIILLCTSLTYSSVWFWTILMGKTNKQKSWAKKPQSMHCGNKQPAALLLTAEFTMLPCCPLPHQWQQGAFLSCCYQMVPPKSEGTLGNRRGHDNPPASEPVWGDQMGSSTGWSRQKPQQPAML